MGRSWSGEGAGYVQGWDILLIWIIIGQRPTVLAVGAVRDCFDIFISLSSLSPSLWVAARYKSKYYLKESLNLNNQPTTPIKGAVSIRPVLCLINPYN